MSRPLPLVIVLTSLVPPLVVLIYMRTFVQNLPMVDMYWVSYPIAIKAQHGTLTLADIFETSTGHQYAITRLMVALTTLLFNWPIAAEAYVTFVLAAANFAMLCWIIYQRESTALLIALFPVSSLIFSLNQSFTWLLSLWSVGIFPIFFFLLALLILRRQPLELRHLGLVALLALCATFSHVSGLAAWPAIFVALWAKGERRWKPLVFWVIASLIGLALFFASVGLMLSVVDGHVIVEWSNYQNNFGLISAGSGESALPAADYDSDINALNPLTVVRAILIYLSNPFVDMATAGIGPLVGAVGLFLLAVNVFYVWRIDRNLSQSASWLALAAFGIGGAILVTFGRDAYAQPERALRFWYVPPAILFWVGAVAAVSIASLQVVRNAVRRWWETLLLGANLLAMMAFIPVYAYYTVQTIQKTSLVYGFGLGTGKNEAVEACYFRALFSRDAKGCPPDTDAMALQFDGLDYMYGYGAPFHRIPDIVAANRLGMFARLAPRTIIQPPYEPGDPVIVETHDLWVNIHIADWLLGGAPPEDVLHIVPGDDQLVGEEYLPDNLVYVDDINEAAIDDFEELVGDEPDFWSVHIAGQGAWGTSLLVSSLGREPLSQTYHVESFMVADFPVLGSNLVVVHYQLASPEQATAEEPYHFGDSMRLEAWALQAPVISQSCQSVTVETTWTATQAIERDNSMTLVLVSGADGSGLVRVDEPPTGMRTSLWRPHWKYVDRRTLEICDVEPGAYDLLIGVYDVDSVTNLPVTAYDGTPVGDWLYLTTLNVED